MTKKQKWLFLEHCAVRVWVYITDTHNWESCQL